MLALGMCGTAGFAQEKEHQVDPDDGFEWYEVTKTVNGEKKHGAEDRYGNLIVPTKYEELIYMPEIENNRPIVKSGFIGYIGYRKEQIAAWYNKNGKCIIPESRGYYDIEKWDQYEFGTYYSFKYSEGFGICDRTGKEIVRVKFAAITTKDLELSFFHPRVFEKKGTLYYYYELEVIRGDLSSGILPKSWRGAVDANGKIILPLENCDIEKFIDHLYDRLTTTTNPLAGNGHDTKAAAEVRP